MPAWPRTRLPTHEWVGKQGALGRRGQTTVQQIAACNHPPRTAAASPHPTPPYPHLDLLVAEARDAWQLLRLERHHIVHLYLWRGGVQEGKRRLKSSWELLRAPTGSRRGMPKPSPIQAHLEVSLVEVEHGLQGVRLLALVDLSIAGVGHRLDQLLNVGGSSSGGRSNMC